MNKLTTSTAIPARAVKIEALANMTASFESFCLASGIEALAEIMENDAKNLEAWAKQYDISTEKGSADFSALSEPRRSAD